MAVKNGENYMHEALDSIMAQSMQALEIIVIDDHSTDLTKKIILQDYPEVSLVDNLGEGQLSAMNLGISLAKGDVLAFLDHDDFWIREKQEIQIKFLDHNQTLEAVTSGVCNFSEDGEYRDAGPARVFGATSFQKNVFSRYGNLDESVFHHGVIEWWLRAERQGINFGTISEVGLMRRIHDTNSGNIHRSASRTDLFSILRNQAAHNV